MCQSQARRPEPLHSGDKVVVCSPAGAVKTERLFGLVDILDSMGYRAELAPHAQGHYDRYSAPLCDRLADLTQAFSDPEVKAIFCGRGGYGCVELLEALNTTNLSDHPKWLIGFSDISALHALMTKNNIISIHGPMARHMVDNHGEDEDTRSLFQLLQGKKMSYEWANDSLNQVGSASGKLLGGNMAVLCGLIGTPFDIFKNDDCIFFFEDINEADYQIQRMMQQLRMNGVFDRCRGVIFGQFTGNDTGQINAWIADFLKPYNIPIVLNAPFGHGLQIAPLPISANVHLQVTNDKTILTED